MQTLNLIVTQNLPILEQLFLEEYLLRTDNQNWCLLNEGSETSIVMGISGKAEESINHDHYRKKPVPIIQRFSGGGTVVVDQETIFLSFIFNSDPSLGFITSDKIHNEVTPFYVELLKGHPFGLIESDYVLNNKKFGGNAQYIQKNRWLHHTSLLWRFDFQKMEYLKHPKKTPKYREQRPHNEFLCSLSDHLPCKNQFLHNILDLLDKNYQLNIVSLESIEKKERTRISTKKIFVE